MSLQEALTKLGSGSGQWRREQAFNRERAMFQQPQATGLAPEYVEEQEERRREAVAAVERYEKLRAEIRAEVLARPIRQVRAEILSRAGNASNGQLLAALGEILQSLDNVVEVTVSDDPRIREFETERYGALGSVHGGGLVGAGLGQIRRRPG